MSAKLIFVEDLLRFKITQVFPNQYLCNCSRDYSHNELQISIGDYVFIQVSPRKYTRLGVVRGFGNSTKVIIGVMTNIGTGTQNVMKQKHAESMSLDEIDGDETEYETLEEALSS
jgi:hypothetical protein